ncbi:MAG: PAS domain S-box protein [Methylococcales bacterium]|nr:PAS domain S-box protein [Methylococcales bacterium]
MTQPIETIRILMLEDVSSDAELEEIELQDAGLIFTLLRVDTREAFEQALDEFKPDIILADYRLPAYSGREALEYTCRTHPRIPVVMVTGALGDEAAVELLKMGARDFVLKGSLARLAPAIKRALSEEQGIRSRILAEDKFRSITASAQDAILMMDNEGRISYWNAAAEKIFGYTAQEALGQNLHALLAPGRFLESHRAGFSRFKETGEGAAVGKTLELVALRKSGTEFPIDLSLSAINWDGLWHAIGIIRDISDRKQAEESLFRANRALKTLSAGNLALLQATQEDELLRKAVSIIVEQGGYSLAVVVYIHDDPQKSITPVAWAGFEGSHSWAENLSWGDSERGQLPVAKAIRSGTTQVCHDIASDPSFDPWRETVQARGYQANIGMPLLDDGKIFGGLSIYASDANAFDDEEVRLLEELANDLAYGIFTLRARKEHEQHARILRQSLEQSIQTIAGTVEARDLYTAGHQRRVAELAVAIAREMGLPEEQISGIHFAAIIHDLGKIHVPAEILSKPGKLSDIEFMLVKTHPQAGYDILKDVKFPWPIADIILQHHERLDGSGYPQGLKGEQILLESRIISVADVIEAILSHRPYRPSLGMEAALDEIKRGRGSAYDPAVVDACLRLLVDKGFQFRNHSAFTE